MKRLLKNNFFKIGFLLSGVFILLAILGYLITPDKTKNANHIMPEWANFSPGSKALYLDVTEKCGTSFWDHFTGREVAVERFSIAPGSFRSVGKKVKFKHLKTRTDVEYESSYFSTSIPQEKTFFLGTDGFGRDILSRLIIGARISLSIGFLAMILSLIIGVTVGLLAGYYGGWIDQFLSWLITVFWSVPTLLLALGLSVVFGKGYYQVLLATGLSTWVEVARVVRGQTLQIKNQEFILSARITGFSNSRIMFKHILPNLTGSLSVLATTNFASAILLEAGLGFLGLGVSPPIPSWGIMVKENLGFLVLGQAYLAVIPGLAIMVLVMAFNFMAMGFREVNE